MVIFKSFTHLRNCEHVECFDKNSRWSLEIVIAFQIDHVTHTRTPYSCLTSYSIQCYQEKRFCFSVVICCRSVTHWNVNGLRGGIRVADVVTYLYMLCQATAMTVWVHATRRRGLAYIVFTYNLSVTLSEILFGVGGVIAEEVSR